LRKEFGPHFGKGGQMTRLSPEQVSAVAEAASDDAGAICARATRAIYALPSGGDREARRAAVRAIEEDLGRAERLGPGLAATLAFRGLAALALGELDAARSDFTRVRELVREDSLGQKLLDIFLASSYGRFGFPEEARERLVALRDSKEVTPWDSVSIRGEAFDDVRQHPELTDLVKEIDRLYLPDHRAK
jgi:hypothetical protein